MYATRVLFSSLATHRLPDLSNVTASGEDRLPEPSSAIEYVGVGDPEAASCAGVKATTVFTGSGGSVSPSLGTQRSPAESKAGLSGPLMLPEPLSLSVTAGVGDPEAASWAGVNSANVLDPKLATHRSPDLSKAPPYGSSMLWEPSSLMVTVADGLPEAASWAGVNSSSTSYSSSVTHRFPAASKRMPLGSETSGELMVIAGTGFPRGQLGRRVLGDGAVAVAYPEVPGMVEGLGRSLDGARVTATRHVGRGRVGRGGVRVPGHDWLS